MTEREQYLVARLRTVKEQRDMAVRERDDALEKVVEMEKLLDLLDRMGE